MISSRFDRDYEFIFELDGVQYTARPPINIAFEAKKSIIGEPNSAVVKIYNLNENKRLAMVKDVEQVKRIPIELSVGYQGQLIRMFKGTAHKASTVRSGVDYVTEIECIDGGFDFLNSFTSRTVKSKSVAVNEILRDMTNTAKGRITEQNTLIRPKVLVGNSAKLIEQGLNAGETYYIDEEKLYIIKDDEVVGGLLPVVSPATGLINTPERADKQVTFSTMLNPTIKIGGQVKLESATAKHLNGVYRVETITCQGEYEGETWDQEITCRLANGFKTL